MKIGFIGAGAVTLAVARRAIEVGHEVVVSSRRGGETLAQAARQLGTGATAVSVAEAAKADMVVLAVPWGAVPEVLEQVGAWDGRILVDATNPFVQYHPTLVLADLGDTGASEVVARLAPGARVVKAFNSIVMENFESGPVTPIGRRVLFVSGDDAPAKSQVKALIQQMGFEPVDLGSLRDGGRLQQAGGPLAGSDYQVGKKYP